MKTDLDPHAKPHVIAVVERMLAQSCLCFVLDQAAAARAEDRP